MKKHANSNIEDISIVPIGDKDGVRRKCSKSTETLDLTLVPLSVAAPARCVP
jgi:hypothetical protein